MYACKDIALPIQITIITVWFFTFLGVFIFPLDVYYSCYSNKIENSDEFNFNSVVKIIWNLSYWIIYVLSWVVIPILQEYEMSGDFTFSSKLNRSIKKNLFFYLLSIIVGVIFVTYLLLSQNFTVNHLISFLISTSNAFGVFIIIFLLGYGLVALPKDILNKSDALERMKYLEIYAKVTQEELTTKKDQLSLILNVKVLFRNYLI